MNTTPYDKQRNKALELQSPRSTEAYALVEIARRMQKIRTEEFNEQEDRQKLIDIYQLNLKLWTIFQSELASPENTLPDEIKGSMLQLANFVDTHTIAQIRNPDPQGLEVLININRQIGAGLMGNSGDAAALEVVEQAQTQAQVTTNNTTALHKTPPLHTTVPAATVVKTNTNSSSKSSKSNKSVPEKSQASAQAGGLFAQIPSVRQAPRVGNTAKR